MASPDRRDWADFTDDEDDEVSSAGSRRSYCEVLRSGTQSAASPPRAPPPVRSPARAPLLPHLLLSSATQLPPSGCASPSSSPGDPHDASGCTTGPQSLAVHRWVQEKLVPLSCSAPGAGATLAGCCFNCTRPGHIARMHVRERHRLLPLRLGRTPCSRVHRAAPAPDRSRSTCPTVADNSACASLALTSASSPIGVGSSRCATWKQWHAPNQHATENISGA